MSRGKDAGHLQCSRFDTVTACLVVQAVRDKASPAPASPTPAPATPTPTTKSSPSAGAASSSRSSPPTSCMAGEGVSSRCAARSGRMRLPRGGAGKTPLLGLARLRAVYSDHDSTLHDSVYPHFLDEKSVRVSWASSSLRRSMGRPMMLVQEPSWRVMIFSPCSWMP